VIPGRANRKKPIRYDNQAYKGRNVIERCVCRLKDFRRIATRYDKLARNFFSSVCLVAAVAYWRADRAGFDNKNRDMRQSPRKRGIMRW
jgi:transposase